MKLFIIIWNSFKISGEDTFQVYAKSKYFLISAESKERAIELAEQRLVREKNVEIIVLQLNAELLTKLLDKESETILSLENINKSKEVRADSIMKGNSYAY